jgi:hypothetical protein
MRGQYARLTDRWREMQRALGMRAPMTMRYEMETPKHFSATAKSNLFCSQCQSLAHTPKETGSPK